MNFDLRLPLGLIFTLYGVMLTIHGLTSDKAIYQKSLGMNVNLGWGSVLLVFGVIMLGFALRSRARARNTGAGNPPRA